MGNLSERKMFQTRGKASFVLVTGAGGGKRSFPAHRCDFCRSRQSRQLRGDTYLEERSGYVGVVGSRSQRDSEEERWGQELGVKSDGQQEPTNDPCIP